MKKTAKRKRSGEEIVEILEELRASGQSQVKFSKRRGFPVSTLQYWLRKEREGLLPKRTAVKSARNELVPVRIVEKTPRLVGPTIELELQGGRTLRFPAGLSPEVLAAYAEALEAAC